MHVGRWKQSAGSRCSFKVELQEGGAAGQPASIKARAAKQAYLGKLSTRRIFKLSPRLAAVRGALSEIQAMGTVDVDDPILSPPGSPASSRRALTPKASVFTAASTGLFEGSSMLDSKPMTAASHVSVASRPKSSFDSITANLKKLPPEAQSALDELTQALHL